MSQFSIVIPALNEEKFLPTLLASLAGQTRTDFDVVVVDGSSRDQTVAVAKSFRPRLPNLQVVVSEKAGASLQRNLGARATSGRWLVFIDADCALLPYCVERLGCFIEAQNPRLLTTWFRPDSEVSGDALFTLLSNLYVEGGLFARRPIAPGPLTVVRRDIFDLVGGYTEAITFGEDFDLTQRITARGIRLQILRETLYVMSLRRVRRDGKRRFVWLYAQGALRVLLTKRNLKQVPSYVMGGQRYETNNEKPIF